MTKENRKHSKFREDLFQSEKKKDLKKPENYY
jgi:hypothetical protein